jgi:hypothetical protein
MMKVSNTITSVNQATAFPHPPIKLRKAAKLTGAAWSGVFTTL